VLTKFVTGQQFLADESPMSWARMCALPMPGEQQRLVHVGVVVHRVFVGDGPWPRSPFPSCQARSRESLRQRRPNWFPVKGIERVAVDQQQRRAAALHPIEDVEAEIVEVQSFIQPGSRSASMTPPPYACSERRSRPHTPVCPSPRPPRWSTTVACTAVAQVLDVDQRTLGTDARADRTGAGKRTLLRPC